MPNPPLTVVWGLGRHGGGLSAATYAAAHGDAVRIVDAAATFDAATLESLDALPGLERRLGRESLEDFADATRIIINPAVPLSHPLLPHLRAIGASLTTELVLTCERHAGAFRVVVTGSNGKSTTAARIAALTGDALPRLHLGGNFERELLGLPGSLLNDDTIRPGDGLVLEVSSFQAAHAIALGQLDAIAATAGVLTSLSPNHLDWHGDFADYAAAKRDLLAATATDGAVILPSGFSGFDDPIEHRGTVFTNDPVAAVAGWLGERFGCVVSENGEAAVSLPHRQCVIGQRDGLRFVDDSAATTPEATMAAVDRFAADRTVLILGGRDKGFDLDALARHVASRTLAVATIGETASELARLVAIHGGKVRSVRTLGKAVRWATKLLRSPHYDGGVVLLSPGMASTDQFADYRERGGAFATYAIGDTTSDA